MKKKAFIFDLDGTLIDSLTDLAASANFALRQLGYPEHDVEKYRMFVGDGVKILMRRVLPESAPDSETERLLPYFQEYYALHYSNKTRPYEGMPEALAFLKNQGIALCVLSNKPHESAVKIINELFEKDTFSIVCGLRETMRKKPDPTALRNILREIGVSHEETVYVGDSGVDMQTAQNAGVFGLGAGWGFRGKEELFQNGASFVVENPSQLKNYI